MKRRRRKPELAAGMISRPEAKSGGERRGHSRILTVYRVAHLELDSDSGLCRVQNISDAGMMLVTSLEVSKNDTVMIALSDKVVLPGEVTWTDGARVGIRFLEEIDVAAVLKSLATASPGEQRPPRLPTDTIAVAVTSDETTAVRVLDISQQGMKLGHDNWLNEGMQVTLSLPNGLTRRCVVRWANENVAGVQLLEPIGFQELESASKL